MENDKSLNEIESLEVISKMIKSAQNDFTDNSFYYLFWGWLVFAASILNYVLMHINYDQAFLPWLVLMPLGGIVTGIYSYKHEKKLKVRSYVDDVMKYVVIAFLISLFIILLSSSKLGLATYPMVMMIYAVWLFISGGAMKFKPLIIGAIINWVLGLIAFHFEFEIQLLLIAAAVLLGYIIPGYLLKSRFHKAVKSTSIA